MSEVKLLRMVDVHGVRVDEPNRRTLSAQENAPRKWVTYFFVLNMYCGLFLRYNSSTCFYVLG